MQNCGHNMLKRQRVENTSAPSPVIPMTGHFTFDYSAFLKETVRTFPAIKTIHYNT